MGCGKILSIGDGDEIRFAKGAPFPKIRFIFPGWEPPEDPCLKEIKARGIAKINGMVDEVQLLGKRKRATLQLQLEQQQREAGDKIALLHGKLKELECCKVEEAARIIISSLEHSACPALHRTESFPPTTPSGTASQEQQQMIDKVVAKLEE